MDVRDLDQDDVIAGHPFNADYLRRARESGMYVALTAGDGGHLFGGIEAGLLLHTTRGVAMRTRSLFGAVETFKPLLTELRARAIALGCSALYLTSSSRMPELCAVARSLGFKRIEGDFAMSRTKARVGNVSSPGVVVRPMHVDEYPHVRERILPIVSGGERRVSARDICRFTTTGAFVPYVAEVEGTVVGYAELATFHTALAACRVGRIERVAVVPEARGRHVGRAVVGELLTLSAGFGCERVDLLVRDGNMPAIRTYERFDFVRTSEIPYWLAL